MEAIFTIMFMISFGLLGIGIGKMIRKNYKKSIIDHDIPKKIWEKDKTDFRYYETNK